MKKNAYLYLLIFGVFVALAGSILIISDTRVFYNSQEMQGDILALDWSSNGTNLLVGARTKIYVWNTNTREIIYSFDIRNGTLNSLYWSPDNIHFASLLNDSNTISIYSISNTSLIRNLNCSSTINTISWSKDGKFLAAGLKNGSILMWNTSNWTNFKLLQNYHSSVTAISWDSINGILFAGTDNGNIIELNVTNNSILNTHIINNSSIVSILGGPPNDILIGCNNGSILLYNYELNNYVFKFNNNEGITHLYSNPEKNQFILSQKEGISYFSDTIKIFSFNSRSVSVITEITDSQTILSACWNNKGNEIVTGSGINRFYIWNPYKGSNNSIFDLSLEWIFGSLFCLVGFSLIIVGTVKSKQEIEKKEKIIQEILSKSILFKSYFKSIIFISFLIISILININFHNEFLNIGLLIIDTLFFYSLRIKNDKFQEVESIIDSKSIINGYKIFLIFIFVFLAGYMVSLLNNSLILIRFNILLFINFIIVSILLIEILKIIYIRIYQ